MYCSCLNQLSGQDEWEKGPWKGRRNHAKREVCLAGIRGLVTSHARSGTPARRHSFYSRQLGMLHATHHFAVTETCLPVDTAGYSLTGEQNTYRDGEV